MVFWWAQGCYVEMEAPQPSFCRCEVYSRYVPSVCAYAYGIAALVLTWYTAGGMRLRVLDGSCGMVLRVGDSKG